MLADTTFGANDAAAVAMLSEWVPIRKFLRLITVFLSALLHMTGLEFSMPINYLQVC